MADRSRDPRSIRTVSTLRTALRESLSGRRLDDVNVSELCRIADVRRTTFYTHYTSVAELLTEMLTSEIDELLDAPSIDGKSNAAIAADFQKMLVTAFELVLSDRHLFRVGFESDAGASLRRALLRMFARRLEAALAIWRELGIATPADITVPVAFSAGGLSASVEAWSLSDDTDAAQWADAVHEQMPSWWPRVV